MASMLAIIRRPCIWEAFGCVVERFIGSYRDENYHPLVSKLLKKQYVPTSIRKKSSTVREQPPRMCKNISSKINCESAIGQHLITNPECTKTYTDDNFRIIGQTRSSFHLGVFESFYIKTFRCLV